MPRVIVPLTAAEKVAGRLFRDSEQAKLLATFDTDPPDHNVPNFLRQYRHSCPKRNGVSTALELKENYVYSPAYEIWRLQSGDLVAVLETDKSAHEGLVSNAAQQVTTISADRFGFIFKTGKCSGCKQTARSKAGKFVDAVQRPPLEGRVAR